MTKYFALPINNENSEFSLFTAKLSGNELSVFCEKESITKENGDKSNLTGVFYPVESEFISYRNHLFPFSGKKRIEKIINFELEPFLIDKNESYSIIFSEYQGVSKKDRAKALCICAKDSHLNRVEQGLLEKKIEITGFFPLSYFQVSSLIRLKIIKDDSIVVLRENSKDITIFAVSQNSVLAIKKLINSKDTSEILKAINFLKNYVSLNIRYDFTPQSVNIVDSFDLKDDIHEILSENSINEVVVIDNNRLEKEIKLNSDFDVSLNLLSHEISVSDSMFFRKKSPGIKKFYDLYKKEILTSGFLFILTFFLFTFQTYTSFKSLKDEHDYSQALVSQTLKKNFPGINKVSKDPVRQAKIELKDAKRNKNLNKDASVSVKKIKILKTIIESVPSLSVELEKITILPVITSITGTADGYNVIDELKSSLEKANIIKSADISMATTDNSGKIRFRLEIDID